MSEVDYQMALLLQYRLEQEQKKGEDTKSDHQLALELQEHFRAELEVEQPKNNLVYKATTVKNSKCLVDPSWEVIDPTPDVHILFIAFDQRFFWNSLGSVTVSWSKRMTTCAGVCSYQGRGGMCSITLSEPLLKLRPRKDLVETLLHEMIHAYLFVTNNNRDRDGHGPEFHKHMYRINAEAGTNITVYHDFHDEVRLYQQHWWRCDGPCQNRKPYFGMVRRATNRAPGPNDRWWDEHKRNCGGTFIKVKSPEAPTKETTTSSKKTINQPKHVSPKNDIRNYVTSTSKPPLPTNKLGNNVLIGSPIVSSSSETNLPKTKSNSAINMTSKNSSSEPNSSKSKSNSSTNMISKNNSSEPNSSTSKSNSATSMISKNIHTVSNNNSSPQGVSNVIPSKAANIFGFTNLGSNSGNLKRPGTCSGVKGAVKNAGSSTFVVSKKGTKASNKTDSNNVSVTTSVSDIQPFSGTGRPLSVSSASNRDYSAVRDHWLKKFDNISPSNSQSNSGKRPGSPCQVTHSPKLPTLTDCDNENKNAVNCPVCRGKFNASDLNDHLDICLQNPVNDTKECIICGEKVPDVVFEQHVSDCAAKSFNDDLEVDCSDLIKCPVCLKEINPEFEPKHIDTCKRKTRTDLAKSVDVEKTKNCPVCKKNLSSEKYEIHVQNCILSMCDEFDKKYDVVQSSETACLACSKTIQKSELESHLDECMSMSNVFDTSNVPIEDDDVICVDDNSDKKEQKDSYNCPFCLELVLEREMQIHINRCLNTERDNEVEEKCLLVKSLCSNDSDTD